MNPIPFAEEVLLAAGSDPLPAAARRCAWTMLVAADPSAQMVTFEGEVKDQKKVLEDMAKALEEAKTSRDYFGFRNFLIYNSGVIACTLFGKSEVKMNEIYEDLWSEWNRDKN